ncbi:hypothetical protein [Sediminispirochaeta bajacaliforniensis]|uniref:hypothetical protein n=1 Tax=Sediminispirochaeta bajacaliforniensis TaxID=148 RepID=UPI0003629DFC|nr:hypothetical protein [Sediminispirochaeta bajacaliforniensis]
MKKMVVDVLKCIVFFLVLIILLNITTQIFVDKRARNEIIGYQDIAKNSVDVLFLGSSKVVTACSPMVIWDAYGITSYNIAMGGQSIPINYYNLKSAFLTQNPEVVVLDVGYAFQKDVFAGQPARFRQWLDFSPFSIVKVMAILDLLPKEEWPDHLISLLYFHNRWKELSKADFEKNIDFTYGAGGGVQKTSDQPIRLTILPDDEITDSCGSDISMQYMGKIIDMCAEKGVKLLLLNVPSRATGQTNHGNGEMLQRQWNAFADYAKENNLLYLNCLHHLDEIGIDFSTDYADWSHANLIGQQKVSLFIGQYLKNNYNLTDHRGEAKYSLWNDSYLIYSEQLTSLGINILPKNYTNELSSLNQKESVQIRDNNLLKADNPLTLTSNDSIHYNKLYWSFEAGSTYILSVDNMTLTEGVGDYMRILLYDYAHKKVAFETKFNFNSSSEWVFTVPTDGNRYTLVFRQAAGMGVDIFGAELLKGTSKN